MLVDCSLVLSPSRTVTSSVIDLRDPDIGKVLPLLLLSKKQSFTLSAYTVTMRVLLS
jgi:hypothetical protein